MGATQSRSGSPTHTHTHANDGSVRGRHHVRGSRRFRTNTVVTEGFSSLFCICCFSYRECALCALQRLERWGHQAGRWPEAPGSVSPSAMRRSPPPRARRANMWSEGGRWFHGPASVAPDPGVPPLPRIGSAAGQLQGPAHPPTPQGPGLSPVRQGQSQGRLSENRKSTFYGSV